MRDDERSARRRERLQARIIVGATIGGVLLVVSILIALVVRSAN